MATIHDRQCCCPTCRGLVTLDRPVFGTGQILTAADLAGLQDYVRAKNRLHTRYLHGWGVVCGLEVVCDDCEGSVTIRPGYAIDPCGSDIVVAQNTRFDLIAAIKACAAQARAKTGDCDPWMPPASPECTDLETTWCIALKYREVETAYTPGLATGRATPAPAASSCGCGGGSGGGGGGCGCGGGCSTPTPAPASAPLSRSSTVSCTPRRVMECFDVTAIQSKEGCVPKFKIKDTEGGVLGKVNAILDLYVPKGTLARKIFDCILADIAALEARLTEDDLEVLAKLPNDTPAQLQQEGITPAMVYAALCRFKAAVMDMLANDDHPVRCQLRRAAGEIVLTAPVPPDSTTPGQGQTDPYYGTAKEKFGDLLAVLLQLMLDCICHAFIPQCDDDPCDDRVEIACVTVKGGKILRICNHSCRRYAGAFPSTFYWMSLVPVLPLAAKLLAFVCCQPDLVRKNSPLVNDLMPLLDRVDPSGGLRTTITANNFALPRLYLSKAAEAGASPLLATIAKRFDIASATVAHTGSDADHAAGALEASGVKVEMATVEAGEEMSLKANMRKHALLRRGDRAKIYSRDGKVVAVVREDDGEIASLRRDLEEMRGRLAKLRPAPKSAS